MTENVGKYCTSCYKKIEFKYSYCFECNTMKTKLENCAEIKTNGHQCKNLTKKVYCFYHRYRNEDYYDKIHESIPDSEKVNEKGDRPFELASYCSVVKGKFGS